MRLSIGLSGPQSGCDRLILFLYFLCHFKLENVMTACSVFVCFLFQFILLFFKFVCENSAPSVSKQQLTKMVQ